LRFEVLLMMTNFQASPPEPGSDFLDANARALLDTLFETIPECVAIIDVGGTLLRINGSGVAMFSAPSPPSPEDLIGKSFYDLIPRYDRDRFRQFSEKVCQGERGRIRFDIITLAGDHRQTETHSAPFRHSNGTVVQLAIIQDVTERQRMEHAALLLGAIVDYSDDAIISKDLNGIITSWNRSAERLFGYTAEEAVGQPVAALVIPADRQDEEPHILARLRRGERVDHFATKRKRKDGVLIDISLTISPVKNAEGRIIGASKIARDITEQVRNQEALRQVNEFLSRSNADLEQFAYSASHDLQEPLRMISTYAEMLRRKYRDKLDARAEEYLGYVIEGGVRMDRLLRDLRAFTHASLADEGPPPEVDAQAVLEQALIVLKPAIDESNAKITHGPLPKVCIHQFQLEQVFQNIVGNAIRYRSEAEPVIHIAAERHGNVWRFSVQDNGIGIADEYKEQIFGIFKRLHAASEYPGTGIGLAICQRIVERSGGRIWVESEPGRGSTFLFELPASTPK
jgi:PAS domain S-box-containing protein